MAKKQNNKIAVLNALKNSSVPLTSSKIEELLKNSGYYLSERTIRIYLKELDEQGLIKTYGKKGRIITPKGLDELSVTNIVEKIGFLSAKIDQMTYKMDFNLKNRTGKVVVNTSFLRPRLLHKHLDNVCKVFDKGYAMGKLACLIGQGERIGNIIVPKGMIGFTTVCSITLNGIILKYGIPTHSKFGGLMEMKKGEPRRFVELINYDGTTIDPLEVFIRSGMTDYRGAISTGNGLIGASFREIPSDSRNTVEQIDKELTKIGLGGFMRIGLPAQPLFDIPVNEGRAGAVVIGGLNPIAVVEESGRRVLSKALSGSIEFERLHHFELLGQNLKKFL
jgi:repressor of nif and glnA expression